MIMMGAAMANIVPDHVTPRDLAEHLGASPRFVSDTVRQLGGSCKGGQTVIRLDHQVAAFLEAMD